MKKKKPGIKEEKILSQLEDLAEGLGIKVRYEQLKKEGAFSPGGLCTVKGEVMFILNSKAIIDDKINALAKGLATYDLSQVHMLPVVREIISKESSRENDDFPAIDEDEYVKADELKADS